MEGEGAPSAGLEERGMVALETSVSDRGKESDGKTDGTDELQLQSTGRHRGVGAQDKRTAGRETVWKEVEWWTGEKWI